MVADREGSPALPVHMQLATHARQVQRARLKKRTTSNFSSREQGHTSMNPCVHSAFLEMAVHRCSACRLL